MVRVHHLQVGQRPAGGAHVPGHRGQTLGLDEVLVGEGREDQAVAVQVGADQQCGAADRIDADESLPAQLVEVPPTEPLGG